MPGLNGGGAADAVPPFDKDMDKTLWLTFLGHPVESVKHWSVAKNLLTLNTQTHAPKEPEGRDRTGSTPYLEI